MLPHFAEDFSLQSAPGLTPPPFHHLLCVSGKSPEPETQEEKEPNMDTTTNQPNGTENVGGYEIPVDPMDLLQCESCQ